MSAALSARKKMPSPRKNYIVRRRLFDRLDGMSSCRLTVVKGGAGMGKTTLLCSYIRERGLQNVKWVTMDDAANSPALFWNDIVGLLTDFLTTGREEFLELFNAGGARDGLAQLSLFLMDNLKTDDALYVVLDDFQVVTDGEVLASFESFLGEAPENLHFILLTRQEPAIYLAGLAMEGALLLVEDSELLLSMEDSLLFLKETLALGLDAGVLESMAALAEGWIGGLQLLAAAAAGKSAAEIAAMRLTSRLIGDYITKEIFESLRPEEQRFLVYTSCPSYFGRDVCLRLLPEINFDAMLDILQRKNLLIVCIDEERGLYRYHNILGEYLRQRFERLGEDVKNGVRRAAMAAFDAAEDYDECLRHALALRDYAAAIRVILKMPESQERYSYMEFIPLPEAMKNADFAFQLFFYYFSSLDYVKCREIYDLAALKMAEDAAFEAFRGLRGLLGDDISGFYTQVMRGEEIDRLGLGNVTKALLMLKNASFMHMLGRNSEGLKLLDRALSYPQSAQNSYILYFSATLKAQIYEDMGCLRKSLSFYSEIEESVQASRNAALLQADFYIGITGIHLKQLNLDAARDTLEKAQRSLSARRTAYDVGYDFNLTEYLFLTGDVSGAMEHLKTLTSLELYSSLLMLSTLLRYVLRAGLMDGPLAEKYLSDYLAADERNRSARGKILYAQLLARRGDDDGALEVANEVLADARKTENGLRLAEAGLFKLSILLRRGGEKRELLNVFREAVLYACNDEIRQPFFYEAETVRFLLDKYGHELSSLLGPAEQAFLKSLPLPAVRQDAGILSERELEVLRALAEGLPNKDIADRLCISLATVKTHIINIYGKLQVSSRLAAAEEAKKLGLL